MLDLAARLVGGDGGEAQRDGAAEGGRPAAVVVRQGAGRVVEREEAAGVALALLPAALQEVPDVVGARGAARGRSGPRWTRRAGGARGEVAMQAVEGARGGSGGVEPAAAEVRAACARAGGRAEVRQVVHGLGRRAGRVDEEHKGGRLARLLGESVVEDQAEHAGALLGPDVVDAHRHLVGLALAVPFQGYEALRRELLLCRRCISPPERFRLGVGDGRVCCRIEVGKSGRGQVRAAGAGVLDDAKVSVRVSATEQGKSGGSWAGTHSDFL